MECGETRGKEGGRRGEEESIKLVGPFDAWHVELVANLKSLVSCVFRAVAWQVTSHLDKRCGV